MFAVKLTKPRTGAARRRGAKPTSRRTAQASHAAQQLRALQKTVGNQAVLRLLAREAANAGPLGVENIRRRGLSLSAGSRTSDVVQRAGDPTAIPPTLACPTDLTPGAPTGTDIL